MVASSTSQVNRRTLYPAAVSAASLARSLRKAASVRWASQPSVSTMRPCAGQ